jgi:hypothetical protein
VRGAEKPVVVIVVLVVQALLQKFLQLRDNSGLALAEAGRVCSVAIDGQIVLP